MNRIRSLASLPVAAVAILALLVSALTFAPPPQILEANSPPARPSGLNATAQDDTILLKWEQAGNVDRYEYQVNHNDTKNREANWLERLGKISMVAARPTRPTPSKAWPKAKSTATKSGQWKDRAKMRYTAIRPPLTRPGTWAPSLNRRPPPA